MIKKFGLRLKLLRKKENMTLEDLAKKFDTTKSTFSGYETGKNFPQCNRLIKIADFFEVSIDYLLGRTDTNNYNRLSLNKYNLDNETIDIIMDLLRNLRNEKN